MRYVEKERQWDIIKYLCLPQKKFAHAVPPFSKSISIPVLSCRKLNFTRQVALKKSPRKLLVCKYTLSHRSIIIDTYDIGVLFFLQIYKNNTIFLLSFI